jgi:hypothetical protein
MSIVAYNRANKRLVTRINILVKCKPVQMKRFMLNLVNIKRGEIC